MIRLACALLVLSAVLNAANGQQKAVAELVDNFSPMNCEELSSRSSAFAGSVAKVPGSKGLAIIYPEPRGKRIVTYQFRLILANFQYQHLDDKIEFVLGKERADRVAEFWVLPPGSAEPSYEGERWILNYDLTKAFVYGFEDEINICGTFVVRKFAELLNANPGSKAHIVVECSGRRRNCAFEDRYIKELEDVYKIDRRRIRLFFARSENKLTFIEYWRVPVRNKLTVRQ